MKYNSAFFGLYENLFLALKGEFGEEKAIKIFRKIMETSLKKAYDAMGFMKGYPAEFARVVKERDKSVGLKVKLKIEKDKIIYRFHTDPFPNLKGKISHEKLDDAYMHFKVNYLLGSKWGYKCTKHIWDNDKFTEFAVEKK
jgi:hypothetical protein